jgi:hypothetical protein
VTRRTRLGATVGLLGLAVAALPATASADSTPIGPLPAPRVTTVATTKGALVSVGLKARKPSTGLVWRVARALDKRVVRQVAEAEVGPAIVLVFEVVGRGRTSITLALTKGESSGKAVQAVRYDIRAT